MRIAATIAPELAARLNALGVGSYETQGDQVVCGEEIALRVLNVGRGRPYEVEEALARISDLDNTVLVATEFGPRARERLAAVSANFMDRLTLHIILERPALSVHVEEANGARPDTEINTLRLGGSAGAVAIALLGKVEGEHRVTELAATAGVSVATAQKVVFGLESEGLLVPNGTGPRKSRRLVDPSGLLDRYAADAARDRRRAVRCRVIGDTTLGLATEVGVRLRDAGMAHALTGVAAALIEAPALTATFPVELWVGKVGSPDYLRQIVGGIPSTGGANVVLWLAGTAGPLTGSHYDRAINLEVAASFRVYADLLANPRRGREQAAVYREEVIGF
jgi:hypothetical protein